MKLIDFDSFFILKKCIYISVNDDTWNDLMFGHGMHKVCGTSGKGTGDGRYMEVEMKCGDHTVMFKKWPTWRNNVVGHDTIEGPFPAEINS